MSCCVDPVPPPLPPDVSCFSTLFLGYLPSNPLLRTIGLICFSNPFHLDPPCLSPLSSLLATTNSTPEHILKSYRLFVPSPETPSSPLIGAPSSELTTPILPVPILSDACLESWIANGIPCSTGETPAGEQQPPQDRAEKEQEDLAGRESTVPEVVELDAVWSWVNGSDPLWYHAYSKFSAESVLPAGWGPPPLRHYRNKDELRSVSLAAC